MYELINAYLAYGTENILLNEVYTKGIFMVFEQGIKNNKYKNSPFNTCLLIQTWIINCAKIPQKLIDDLINLIITKINEILNEYKKNNNSTGEDNYNFLGFVTVILSGLINYSNVIIPNLTQRNNGNSLKYWLKIIDEEDEPGYEYEIKIIIYSICIIIKNGIITGNINDLLDISIELLKDQEHNAKYEIKKKERKKIKSNFERDDDDDQSDSDDNDSENELSEYKEIKDLIDKTINPMKNIDEFKMFNELLIFLKNNQKNFYEQWEKNLGENKKILVNKLFGTKRINIIGENNTSMQIPRRIITIKRNQNQNQNNFNQ